MVVVDTCAIIEGCKAANSFSAKALRQIMDGAYILTISFAEIACKAKVGKLELSISPRELHFELNRTDHIQIIDISAEMWLDAIELPWDDNKDPADRVITAFAAKRDLPIATTDRKIQQFYKNTIW